MKEGLNERLCKWIERASVLGEQQNGFRVDKKEEDNMLVVNELVERRQKGGRKMYFVFQDIEKSYDKVVL